MEKKQLSWPRAYQAGREVLLPLPGAWKQAVTAIGYFALLVGISFNWTDLMPPTLPGRLLFVCLVLLFLGLGIRASYRLQSELDALGEDLASRAIPRHHREQIQELRDLANRVDGRLELLPFHPQLPNEILALLDGSALVREYESVYSPAVEYGRFVYDLSESRHRRTGAPEEQNARRGQLYRELTDSIKLFLLEHPEPVSTPRPNQPRSTADP